MKFFDREDKIERLRQIRERSLTGVQFTVLVARRRVGKTEFVQHALSTGKRPLRNLSPMTVVRVTHAHSTARGVLVSHEHYGFLKLPRKIEFEF